MLFNLKKEIIKLKKTQREIAEIVGIDAGQLSRKINEEVEFSRHEMYEINDKIFPELDMYYLFYSIERNTKNKPKK